MVFVMNEEGISTHILTRRMTNRYRVKSIKKSISTHILTRRMTEKDDDIESEADISTHILTRRMTTDGISATFPGIISTHILTRRMTWLRRMPLAALRYFNSHPHKEDDRNGKKVAISKKYFNSHPHKEDDASRATARTTPDTFQLTSSQGG